MRKTNLSTKKQPVALACGLLEDNGRTLFLTRLDQKGATTLELPAALTFPGENIALQLANAFKEQTGIDGQVKEAVLETRFNCGSRKHKNFVPCFAFRVIAKNCTAKPSKQFNGFKWIPLQEAKSACLSRNSEWLKGA